MNINFSLGELLKNEKLQGALKTAILGAAIAGLLAWMFHVEKMERGELD